MNRQLPTPMATKATSRYGLSAAKSASCSCITLLTNQTVPSNIKNTPTGTDRGNLRAAAAKACGFSKP
jgi:hypothetical protein